MDNIFYKKEVLRLTWKSTFKCQNIVCDTNAIYD